MQPTLPRALSAVITPNPPATKLQSLDIAYHEGSARAAGTEIETHVVPNYTVLKRK